MLISCAVLLALLVVAWRGRHAPAGGAFALTIVAALIWTVSFTLELATPSLQAKLMWTTIQFLGIAPVPLLWLTMVLTYLGRQLPRWALAALSAIPIATVVLAWTNPLGVFFGTPSLMTAQSPIPMLFYDYGPWYRWVWQPYAFVAIIAAVVLLIDAVRRARGRLRWQCALLLAATVLPVLTTGMYASGVAPIPGYNTTAAAFAVSGVLMALALFRFSLFDLAPLARDAVVEHMVDPVVVLDAHDNLADFNPAAARLLPALCPAVIGLPVSVILADEPDLVDQLRAPRTTDAEIVVDHDGSRHHFSLDVCPVRDTRGRLGGRSIVLHDITERIELFERVKELASLDPLTGIFNRRHFFELSAAELERARRYDAPVSLVLFDLDHFKEVNDTYGHQAGDSVLRAVASACSDRLRSFDVLGRYGGEEFAVLLPEIGPEGALAVAERLRRGIAAAEHDVTDADVTASFGVASVATAAGVDLDELLHLADQALYRAKRRGRDCVDLATCIPAPVGNTA